MGFKVIIIGIAGFAWISWLRIGQDASAIERIILGICLSFTCTLLMSFLFIIARLPFKFVGYAVLVPTLGLLSIWLRSKPRAALPILNLKVLPRFRLPVVLFSFHILLWTMYMINYPYFPSSEPNDAVWHAEITLSILKGAFTTPVAPAGFAGGAHILFAFVSAYFGVSVLTAERVTAAFVESLSVLVAYCLFQRILPSKKSADYASVAFALIVPAGFVYYPIVGAYPNIVGDFFVLTSLLLAVVIQTKPTSNSVATAFVVEAMALVSHVSVLVFTMLVIGFSIIVFRKFRSQFRAYLISNLGFVILPVAAVIVSPLLVWREVAYVSFLYLDLSNDFGMVIQVWLRNYLFLAGSLNFVLLVVAFVWTAVKWRAKIWPTFLVAWFTVLFLLVFVGTQDWRMILLSFVPGAGLLGIVLSKLEETIRRWILPRLRASRIKNVSANLLIFGLILTMAASGPTAFALTHASNLGQTARQGHIYDSMVWIQTKTSTDSVVVSIDLPLEYRYLTVLTNRTYVGDFELNSTGILKLQSSTRFNYVAVSTDYFGLSTFYGSNRFHSEYHNPDVVVFVITT